MENVPLEMHHTTYLSSRDWQSFSELPEETQQAYIRRFGCPDYKGIPFPNLGIEEESDLLHLCRDCHRNEHIDPNGDFWGDIDELRWHWEGYYDAIDDND